MWSFAHLIFLEGGFVVCSLEAIHPIAIGVANNQSPAICCYEETIVSEVLVFLSGECNYEPIRQGCGPICALSGFT